MEIFKSPYHLSFQAVPYSLGDPIKMKEKKKNPVFVCNLESSTGTGLWDRLALYRGPWNS